MDFAKRKYRPGYYVNLSSKKANSHQPIAISHSKEFDKKIADLSPIISKKESSIPNSQLSILPSQFILSTPIKNNFQNVPIYNRSENRVIENKIVSDDKPEPERKWCKEALVSFGFLVLAAILFTLAAVIGINNHPIIYTLIKIAVPSLIISIILSIVAYTVFKKHPELKGRGFAYAGLILVAAAASLGSIALVIGLILLSRLH